jgi:hypothetical protein
MPDQQPDLFFPPPVGQRSPCAPAATPKSPLRQCRGSLVLGLEIGLNQWNLSVVTYRRTIPTQCLVAKPNMRKRRCNITRKEGGVSLVSKKTRTVLVIKHFNFGCG